MFVREWMSSPVLTIGKGAEAASAMNLMEQRKVRRLPVVERGLLVGIVTRSDLQAAGGLAGTVGERMTKAPLTVAPGDSLEQAAKLMLEKKVSGLPVIERGRVAGILTESDVFRAFCEMLGLTESGARVVFSVPDSDDLLEAVKRRRSGLALRSLATVHDAARSRWEVVMRLRGRAKKT